MADIGIDLGTATVLVYDSVKGLLIKEPSVVAIDAGSGEVLKVGEEAFKMIGRTPDRIRALYPLKDGVISDFDQTEQMLRFFLKKASEGTLSKPRVCICVPSGITGVESRACVNAAVSAGARKVYLIEEPVAAALGAGLDLAVPRGRFILDMGGGTTDIAVLSLNGIVCKKSIKLAGRKLDDAIVRAVRQKFNVLIGEKMAERVKIEIGSVHYDTEKEMEVKGRNLHTGLPQKFTLRTGDIYDALMEEIMQIVTAVQQILEISPPELAADILEDGLIMTGGGAQLDGLDRLISEHAKIGVRLAERPEECVAIGTALSFSKLDELYDGFVTPSTHTH